MKIVSSEIGRARLVCNTLQGEGGDDDEQQFCFDDSECRLIKNETNCLSDRIPKRFELKDVVCEKCVEGRAKIRPVVESREICQLKDEEFCLDVVEQEEHWRKWCRPIETKEYNIEIRPGEWITVNNTDEADLYLEQQDRNEAEYVVSTTVATTTTTPRSATAERRRKFRKRIRRCLFTPKNCRYS